MKEKHATGYYFTNIIAFFNTALRRFNDFVPTNDIYEIAKFITTKNLIYHEDYKTPMKLNAFMHHYINVIQKFNRDNIGFLDCWRYLISDEYVPSCAFLLTDDDESFASVCGDFDSKGVFFITEWKV